MAQKRVRQTIKERVIPNSTGYYALLGLHPSASPIEIRRVYRELSKLYHPDTTNLPNKIATAKFQELNQAYATLSNPERRTAYDYKIGYSNFKVISPYPGFNTPVAETRRTYSASNYLDPTERPLSTGEVFALFILGLTFLGCLLLAIAIGLTRGESAVHFYGTQTQYLPKHKIITEQKNKGIELQFYSSSNKPSSVNKAPKIDQ